MLLTTGVDLDVRDCDFIDNDVEVSLIDAVW